MIDDANSKRGNKYPSDRRRVSNGRQAGKIARSTYTRWLFTEKGTRPTRQLDICTGNVRDPGWHTERIEKKKYRGEVFLAELWPVHSTNWRFFLLPGSPSTRHCLSSAHRLLLRSAGTRGKALLMRSLIRSIEGCFADRSDVYPSRSATTRCASSPQHAAKRT